MCSKSKKQHYVLKLYLRNFSIKKNKKDFIIYCFDKENVKQYSSNINQIAQEKDFYKLNNSDFERSFGQIESKTSSIINNLVKYEKFEELDKMKNRSILSYFLSIQYIRTSEMRLLISEQCDKLYEVCKEMGFDEDLIKDLKNRNIKKDHLRILNKFSEDIGAIFLLKKGVIIKNNTDLNFWTSDNPIVRYNPNGDLGFNCDLIHVFFPLSPKLCLCLLDPFNYSNYSVEKKFDENNVEENIKAISIFN